MKYFVSYVAKVIDVDMGEIESLEELNEEELNITEKYGEGYVKSDGITQFDILTFKAKKMVEENALEINVITIVPISSSDERLYKNEEKEEDIKSVTFFTKQGADDGFEMLDNFEDDYINKVLHEEMEEKTEEEKETEAINMVTGFINEGLSQWSYICAKHLEDGGMCNKCPLSDQCEKMNRTIMQYEIGENTGAMVMPCQMLNDEEENDNE